MMSKSYAPLMQHNQRGIAVLEIILAATLVAIGFVGVTTALTYATATSRLASDTIIADDILAAILAEARTNGYENLTSWYTNSGETNTSGLEKKCHEQLVQARLANAQAWLTVTQLQSNIKGVSVVITWGSGAPGGKVEATTLVAARF